MSSSKTTVAKWLGLILVAAAIALSGCRSAAPPTPTIPPPADPTVTNPATASAAPTTQPPTTVPSDGFQPTIPTRTAAPPPAAVPPSTLFDLAWDDRSLFQSGILDSEQGVLEQLPSASVYHLELVISDDLAHLDGRQEVYYTNQESASLEELYFRLFPNLADGTAVVFDLTINDQPATPEYELEQSAMRVPLTTPLLPGEHLVIAMNFAVDVPQDGGGNYGTFALMDNILALAHFYPMIPVYDDEGWNVEIAPEIGDVVYADSSFYLVRVTAPAGLTLVASGVETAREAQDGRTTVTYAAGPVRDFYLVGSPDYTVISEQVGATTINSYAPGGAAEGAQRALTIAVDALTSYNERFGLYPFTELDVAATPTAAGGVEYPGIVVIGLRLYENTGPASFFESATAHEVGHQWFYSVIGNDQLDDPWLDEALTQYATAVYYGDVYGPTGEAGFWAAMQDRWDRVEGAAIPIGLPVSGYTALEYGAIVYGRGPLFFHTLAETMGQATFDAFLQDYYRTFKWGIVTPESLQELAEQHCVCDLTTLFEEWVYDQ
ncbi:MAG: M1 family metallopeptidase [Chloroflexota bacterium]